MPRQRANERACDKAIRTTLAYRSIFKYPLSFYQLTTFLISDRSFKYDFFKNELQKMAKKGYIQTKGGKYYLNSIKPVSWEVRKKNAETLLENNQHIFEMLKIVPWIKFLGVTGSVAAFNADKTSDIDIFIISAKNRLWLTRGFTAILLKIAKTYVRVDAEPGKLCPNLFVDESALEWPKEKQTVYTAHEIALIHPIFQRENTYFKFLAANDWVKKYLPHFNLETGNLPKSKTKLSLVDGIENTAMKLQMMYMKRKKTKEVTNKHIIHFNKNDNGPMILEHFEKLQKV
ncbi:hypothetical protein A2415_04040 [candidate division WWE3 bacterium RIFOXYC1_FULL_39_7]|uniref:Polymerase nucleotidyl transferase domain-containing protein n=2 Tax=Katanobacteria TaxID=422282 RepID=A0A1F4X632_UNCKA|nr:MAG: hypothetical protein A2415_04040 [candidate division WWE3 bacterium RIFOXYC1_FULL_39_7]OGC76563.1 MAG: hypothetical protein A2619_02475 [candidate division WWE3 bacterium RIFOXYD1_FULL_39_9]